MISGQSAVIRSVERDDHHRVAALYNPQRPHAFLLDKVDELPQPNADEIAQLLASERSPLGTLYAVEDTQGRVKGFASMRGFSREASYCELGLLLADNDDYAAPLAEEALEFLLDATLGKRRLNKVLCRTLSCETAWRDFLLSNGFASGGFQREVFFGAGAWHHIETFSLFARDWLDSGDDSCP